MIGLIDVDGKIPNLALMKISSYYKGIGEHVEFVQTDSKVRYDKIFASTIFTKSKNECEDLIHYYGDTIEIGGTGWNIEKTLPPEIESCKADYKLYSPELVASRIKTIGTKENKLNKATVIANAGMGFSSRGCVRKCAFCFVPKKEGDFKQGQKIADMINPRSNVIILHDNNLTADPNCIDKLHEIRDRKLIVDINQGCDVRLVTEDISKALSEVRHLRSIHYAWDLMAYEKQVLEGIKTIGKHIKSYRQMCYVLVGFNTTFEEDYYRFRRLVELGIKPYIMRYNELPDPRLKHFARWVNANIYKVCAFEDYEPWLAVRRTEHNTQISWI